MHVVIQQATAGNANAIARLSKQLGYSISSQDTEKNILSILDHPDHAAFIALTGNEVAGWIHVFYTLRLETGPFAEIGGMVVDEKLRSQGIGKLLVKKAQEWAAEKNAETLRVRCNTLRPDAHRFYADQGFLVSKDQKVFVLKIES